MKNSGKSFGKGKFSSSKGDKKEFKKKDGKDSPSTQGIVCYECNGYGHLNECEKNLQEVYDPLLEDCGKYAKVANNAIKKMKKIEEEHCAHLCNLRRQSVKLKG